MALEELAGSPRFGIKVYDNIGDGCHREFICNWNEIDQAVQQLAGSTIRLPNGNIVTCTKIEIVPYQSGSSVCAPKPGVEAATYDKARITAIYGEVGVILDWSGYYSGISERLTATYETVAVPVEGYYASYDGQVPIQGFSLDVPHKVCSVPLLEYTVFKKGYGPVGPLVAHFVGCVNSVPFITRHLGYVWEPGRVKYVDFEIGKTWVPGSLTPTVLTMRFLIHPVSWNKVFSPAAGGWVYVHAANMEPIRFYTGVDLNLLLS